MPLVKMWHLSSQTFSSQTSSKNHHPFSFRGLRLRRCDLVSCVFLHTLHVVISLEILRPGYGFSPTFSAADWPFGPVSHTFSFSSAERQLLAPYSQTGSKGFSLLCFDRTFRSSRVVPGRSLLRQPAALGCNSFCQTPSCASALTLLHSLGRY